MTEYRDTNETEDTAASFPKLNEAVVTLLAGHEDILRLVEQTFPVKIYARGSVLSIKGEDEKQIGRAHV